MGTTGALDCHPFMAFGAIVFVVCWGGIKASPWLTLCEDTLAFGYRKADRQVFFYTVVDIDRMDVHSMEGNYSGGRIAVLASLPILSLVEIFHQGK